MAAAQVQNATLPKGPTVAGRRRFVLAACLIVGIGLLGTARGAGGTETVTVTKRHVVKRTRTVTATETEPSTASSSTAHNLAVTPAVRQAVRNAVITGEDRSLAKKTKGPLTGMYYGDYQGVEYAVAAFSMPYTGTTDQPTLFVRLPHVPWFVSITDLGGAGPLDQATVIPCPLRQVWDIGCAESP